jgi:LEA14-like dessication related protein
VNRRFLARIIIFLAPFSLLLGCSSLDKLLGEQRPEASIVGANLSSIDAESATIVFDVEVNNPYGIELPLLGIDFGLNHQGQEFLNGAMSEQGSIPSNGSKTLPITAKIPFASALQILSELKPGAVVPYEALIGLTFDLPSFGEYRLPLRKSGEFPIPAIPDVSIEDFQWEKLGLTGAIANIAFKFGNTNQFPITLNDLAYSFNLAGRPMFKGSVDEKLDLGAGEDGAFNLRLELKPSDLGMAALNMLRGGEANYGFVGDALLSSQFGDIALPIDNRGKTTMKK